MTKTQKILVWVGVAAVVAIVGYLLWKRQQEKAQELPDPNKKTPGTTTPIADPVNQPISGQQIAVPVTLDEQRLN